MVQKCVVYKKIRKCQRNLFSVKLEVFGLVVLYPTRSIDFNIFGTSKHGEENSLSDVFFAILISTL